MKDVGEREMAAERGREKGGRATVVVRRGRGRERAAAEVGGKGVEKEGMVNNSSVTFFISTLLFLLTNLGRVGPLNGVEGRQRWAIMEYGKWERVTGSEEEGDGGSGE